MKENKPGWKELPIGTIIPEAGNALQFKTGDWRSNKPIWDKEKCTSCLICFIYCPDSAIIIKDEKMIGIDLDYCKGCGICELECPVNAIKMEIERR
ncbi:4Fe-4S binding protein [candidate division WOR-3 bacterium]|nr:4Fe-4S binding protein [candidate division WOR-3 bacterium]